MCAQHSYNIIFWDNSSSDEVEFFIEESLNRHRKRQRAFRREPHRIQLFSEVTIRNSTDKEFQSHFRMTRQTFKMLLEITHLENTATTGRPTILAEKQLLTILWLLATPDSYR